MLEKDKDDLTDLVCLATEAVKRLYDVDETVPLTGSDVVRLASAVVVAKELRRVREALDYLGSNM